MKLLQHTDEEIVQQLHPLIEGFLSGIDQDDHEMATASFSSGFRDWFTLDNFQEQRRQFYPLIGNHIKVSFIEKELHRGQDDVCVLWEIEYEKQPCPLIFSSKFKEEDGRVVVFHAHLLSDNEWMRTYQSAG
jgi:hypothetical protein